VSALLYKIGLRLTHLRKKKKSNVKSELSLKEQDLSGLEDLISKSSDKEKGTSNNDCNSPALSASSSSTRKTKAEKRFEEAQKERVCFVASLFFSCD